MQQDTNHSKPRSRGRLARKVLILLLPLTLLPFLVMGAVSFYSSYIMLRSQVDTQLESLLQSQIRQAGEDLQRKQDFLVSLARSPGFQTELDSLLEIKTGDPLFSSVRSRMLLAYQKATYSQTQGESSFSHLMVVLPDSTILISTQPEWESQKLAGQPGYLALLQEPKSIALSNTPPLYENRLVTLTSLPYIVRGRQAATLIGLSDPVESQHLLENTVSFHPQARAYLVTSENILFGLDKQGGSLHRLEVPESTELTLLDRLSADDRPATFEMTSFGEVEVLAIAGRIQALQASMVIEVPQSTVYGQIQSLVPFSVITVILTILFSGVVIWWGTSRLVVRPIDDLNDATRRFAEGEWLHRAQQEYNDEIGDLAVSFNQMADELTNLYRSLESMVEERSQQVRTAAEVAQLATSSSNLDELLNRTVQLMVERFEYFAVSIFIVDEAREYAVQRALASSREIEPGGEFKLPIGSRSLIGWATANNEPKIVHDTANDPLFLRDETLPDTKSEAVIPLAFGDFVLGALDLQSAQVNAFGQDEVTILRTIANQIAIAIYNIRLLEATTVNIEEASLLYQASRRITQAESPEGILRVVAEALAETSYMAAILVAEGGSMRVFSNSNPYPTMRAIDAPLSPAWLPIPSEALTRLLPGGGLLFVENLAEGEQLPEALKSLLDEWGCEALAMLPMMRAGDAPVILLIGAPKNVQLTTSALQPYASLAELTATAIEKVNALQNMQQRLAELQALNTTSQIVAGGSTLQELYRSLHKQVAEVMGETSFLIALYNADTGQVEIPYMYELSTVSALPPFPLGEGLTSILIRTCQPLMIVEDTERRAHELGAKVFGPAAKSWLGVPLVVSGEAIGALVVQDIEHEQRFNENDLRVLATLAGQVAATIYNVRLLEQTRRQAELEHRLHEVVTKIRSSSDIHTILATTAKELSLTLGAHRARVELGVIGPALEGTAGNGHRDGARTATEMEPDLGQSGGSPPGGEE